MRTFRKVIVALGFITLILSNVCFAKSTLDNKSLRKAIDKRCHMYMKDIESKNGLPKGELVMVGGNDVIVSCVVNYTLPGPTGVDIPTSVTVIGNFNNLAYEIQER